MTQSINSTLHAGFNPQLTASEIDNEIVAVSTYKGTSAAIGGTPITPGLSVSSNVSINGVDSTMAAVATPHVDPGAGIVVGTFIPATGIVSVRLTNASNATITPTSTVYQVRVLP